VSPESRRYAGIQPPIDKCQLFLAIQCQFACTSAPLRSGAPGLPTDRFAAQNILRYKTNRYRMVL